MINVEYTPTRMSSAAFFFSVLLNAPNKASNGKSADPTMDINLIETAIGRSEIEHSIVLEGSLIHDLETRVADSLIGRGVKIHREPLKPVAHRFMLGDNSEVWIKW